MEKNNNTYGPDRKKEGVLNDPAENSKNQDRQNSDRIGAQYDQMKSGSCDKQHQTSASQNGSEWKQQENGAQQGGRTNVSGEKYGENKDRQHPGSQNAPSANGSHTAKHTPGMNGTEESSGTSDKEKTENQTKTTPGGSY